MAIADLNEYAVMRRYTYRCEAVEDIADDLGIPVSDVMAIVRTHSKAYAQAVKDNPQAVQGDALIKLKVIFEKLQTFLNAALVDPSKEKDPIRCSREMRETLRDYMSIALRDSGIPQTVHNGEFRLTNGGIDANLLRDTISALSRHIGNTVTLNKGIEFNGN